MASEHMEVYNFSGEWRPIPVKCAELLDIWQTWHGEKFVRDAKESKSVAMVGIIASNHIEELFNHIAYLELQIEQLHRRIARN